MPIDDYEVEIHNTEGEVAEAGEAGEMWVKGPSVLSSYWKQPDQTSDKIRGDWFLSGDRYHQDGDGYYTYLGRIDDMMKIGGLWVSPIEIENRLMEHEAVHEAAVVAVNIDNQSRIKAAVILNEGYEAGDALTAELQQWCKAALQRYQFPHVVDYVEDFPRTATGKIQRFQLRE
jgi:benzoate-CoA ligase